MEGAVFDNAGDVVECASDANAPVVDVVAAKDWEGEYVAEGAPEAGDGESVEADNLEISFIILRTG